MTDKEKEKGSNQPPSTQDDAGRLSLSIIPLSSPTLKSLHLVKNTRLETMVELHSDPVGGSLQIRPEDIQANFPGTSKDDQEVIAGLSKLNSYDVYSLRFGLQQLGIEVDKSALALSDEMTQKLERYALEFTRPMVMAIFGDSGAMAKDKKALENIFNEPDIKVAEARLKTMSEKIGVPIAEIPAFLNNYRDLFLGTLYFRENFDSLTPDLNRLWHWLDDLMVRREGDASQSQSAAASCKKVSGSLKFLFGSTQERLNRFKDEFGGFWKDMSPRSFDRLRRNIENNHASMGAVLCGLSVKIHDWARTFPGNDTASPAARIKYVITELEPGLEKLTHMENDARLQIGMRPMRGFMWGW